MAKENGSQENQTVESSNGRKGFRYQFMERQYPSWLYTIAISLFALGCYIWIEFFLVVGY